MDRLYDFKSSPEERDITQPDAQDESTNLLTDQVIERGGRGCRRRRRSRRSRSRRSRSRRSRSRRSRRRRSRHGRSGCRRSRRSRRHSRRSKKRSCTCKIKRRRRSQMIMSTNPFIIFYLEQLFKNPGKRVTIVARSAGKKWCAMSKDKRCMYIRMAEKYRKKCGRRRR